MADIKQQIELITTIVTLLAFLAAAAAGIFLFFQLAPVLKLRILPTWLDESKEYLCLHFEIENSSRVRVYAPQIRIQVLEYQLPSGGTLSEWVPFRKETIRPEEPPTEWKEPVQAGKSTKRIFPTEIISIERLYHYPQQKLILHVALQVEVKLSLIGRVLTRKSDNWRQTTSRFVLKQ